MSLANSILKRFASTMKQLDCKGYGSRDVLFFGEAPIPKPKEHEVLLKIKASALNRADILQRQGKYPPPKNVTNVLGLEAVGTIVDSQGKEGKRALALLAGGGQAEYVSVNKGHILEIPDELSFESAAAIAETWITAYQLLKYVGTVKAKENVLIYAGAGGVGTAALQLCQKVFNANSIVSVSTKEKLEACLKQNNRTDKLGAAGGIIYKGNTQQKEQLLEITQSKGIDVILDCIGAQNAQLSWSVLREDARWVLYGLMGGHKVPEFNLAALVAKRASLICSTLRNRSDEYKSELVADFGSTVLPLFKSGELVPVVDRIIEINWNNNSDIEKIREAHQQMEQNQNVGKIVLRFKS